MIEKELRRQEHGMGYMIQKFEIFTGFWFDAYRTFSGLMTDFFYGSVRRRMY